MKALINGVLNTVSALVVLGATAFVVRTAVVSMRPPAATAAEHVIDVNGWLGSPDAPVLVIVYSDYACGFCKSHHESLSELLRRYPDHVRVGIKHFVTPRDFNGFRVALGAECAAEQGQFEGYHAAAFSNSDVVQYTNGWLTIGEAAEIVDMDRFKECVWSGKYAAAIEGQHRQGLAAGVSGTPTTFIGSKRVVGAVPHVVLDSVIVGALPSRAAN